jgi:AraC family transcriptional regulator, transcriptional activator of pobA
MSTVHPIVWEDAYSAVLPLINAEGLLVSSFDALAPMHVHFYRYDRQRDFRMCRHDHFEVFLVHSGQIMFQLQERLYPMAEGDLIIINSTQYHKVHPTASTLTASDLDAVLLHFLPDWIRNSGNSGEEMEYLMPFLQQDSKFPHVIPAQTGIPAQIYDLIQQIAAELPASSQRARLSVKTYLRMILIKLLNHYTVYQSHEDVFDVKRRRLERLRPLFNHLDQHFSEPIPLEDAASIVNMSQSHFLHFFKQVTGQSFVNYLNQFRVARAQALLATTDKSIAEVSQEVGFCDQSYFGQVFRKFLHMTPREYKSHLEDRKSPSVR